MEGDRFNVLVETVDASDFGGWESLTSCFITDKLSQKGISPLKGKVSAGHAVVRTKSQELANILCKFMNSSCSDAAPFPSIFSRDE